MKPITFFFIITSIIIFFSCKKKKDDKDDKNSVEDLSDYYPLAVGNYWVYQWYDTDPNGVEKERTHNPTDTFRIVGDSMINGVKYYKLEYKGINSATKYYEYQRDSSNHLINHLGSILFSAVNFTDTFNYNHDTHTDLISFQKMDSIEVNVSTPLGIFNGLNGKITYFHASNPTFIRCPNGILYSDKIYSRNIGMVMDNYRFASNCTAKWERRLIAYHLN